MAIENITLNAALLLYLISGLAHAMQEGDSDFLRSPPQELSGLKNPRVISFGCGRTVKWYRSA